MNHNDITNILKSNPDLSYDDAKKQAKEAGVSEKDFEKAWRNINSDFHDKRIVEIINELKKRGENQDRDAIKSEFKGKGYLDDEIDLAFSLQNAEIKTVPALSRKTLFILPILAVGLLLFIYFTGNWSENMFQIVVYTIGFPILAVVAYVASQKKKLFLKTLCFDFKGKELATDEIRSFESKLSQNGASYIKRSRGHFENIIQIEYDRRPTSFGDFTYTIGSGKNRRIYTYLFIIQKTHKSFPPVQCYKNSMHFTSFIHGKDIELESTEFNDMYKINSSTKESDAFYVLNPRVMSAFIEKDKVDELFLFETVDDEIMVGFKKMGYAGNALRLKPPIIRYDEYKNIKDHLIRCLDIATDLNDVLCRQIVDSGEKRSVAKEV